MDLSKRPQAGIFNFGSISGEYTFRAKRGLSLVYTEGVRSSSLLPPKFFDVLEKWFSSQKSDVDKTN